MKTLKILIASVTLLYSCDKAKTNVAKTEVPKSDSAVNITAETVAAPAEVASVTNASTSGKPALNPEHGQPYHRCEIAVGAPIDSAPTQQSAPAPQPNASVLSPYTTSPATPSPAPVQALGPKPAVNPAHGEPHHRCDLAVGAPLS